MRVDTRACGRSSGAACASPCSSDEQLLRDLFDGLARLERAQHDELPLAERPRVPDRARRRCLPRSGVPRGTRRPRARGRRASSGARASTSGTARRPPVLRAVLTARSVEAVASAGRSSASSATARRTARSSWPCRSVRARRCPEDEEQGVLRVSPEQRHAGPRYGGPGRAGGDGVEDRLGPRELPEQEGDLGRVGGEEGLARRAGTSCSRCSDHAASSAASVSTGSPERMPRRAATCTANGHNSSSSVAESNVAGLGDPVRVARVDRDESRSERAGRAGFGGRDDEVEPGRGGLRVALERADEGAGSSAARSASASPPPRRDPARG